MWEYTIGKKSFHDFPHDHHLTADILNGMRPKITKNTPKFYADLMKRCWNHYPENRPTALEISNILSYRYYNEDIELAE